MLTIITKPVRAMLLLAVLQLAACGGAQRAADAAITRYTVGGAVSGLVGSVVLQNNGRDNLTVAADGNFTFTEKFGSGNTYAVTVLTQPASQTCTVSTGAGTVSGNNVGNVAVTCSINAYTVGGSVSGLTGSVVLQDNNGDNLTVSANGAFTFATKVASGSPYSVTVLTQPTGQSCSVANGTGTMANANIGNVTLTCAASTYTVGGTVSGLSGTVVLQNNSGDNLSISTNGNFTFASAISDGGAYTVTVLTQPTGQTCTVSAGAGTVSGGNVTGIALVCATNTFEVVVDAGATGGGTWSGTNPDIFTSNASVATVSVTDIQSRLNAGIPVTIVTSPAALGNGDISVSSAVSWPANTLTLKAHRNITFNAALNGSGTAGLALEYGQGAVAAGNTSTYKVSAPVNLASTGSFSTKLGSDGAVNSYTILTSLGLEGDATVLPATMTLQGMRMSLAGNYVLGGNIDASGTSTWNGGLGFAPVGYMGPAPGYVPVYFTGIFDGLGHTITGLTINREWENYVALFGATNGATLRNVGLINGNVTGQISVGALAGVNTGGSISYCYADGGSVTGSGRGSGGSGIGGLMGSGAGSISNSYATVSVTANTVGGATATSVGGLKGVGNGNVTNSYATGSVHGVDRVGGLVGQQSGGNIGNSYATGAVTGTTNVGGLVSTVSGGATTTNSYWDIATTGQAASASGTGKTTAEMKAQATFSGWDFVGMWKIVEGVSYPTLR